MDPNVVMNRLVRLAKLDTTVFDEVRDDTNELIPALVIAAISSLLAGLGSAMWWKVIPDLGGDRESLWVNQFILGSVFMFVMLIVIALVVYVIMAQMYKVQTDVQSLIRTVGYASFPMALSLLMFVPLLWPIFAIVPLALLMVMLIYAVQSATSAESSQVVMATLIGFVVFVFVLGLVSTTTDFAKAPIGAGLFGIISDFA
ncbi:MAG: YIP1 family protein [Tepidiformaceae bacterium]